MLKLLYSIIFLFFPLLSVAQYYKNPVIDINSSTPDVTVWNGGSYYYMYYTTMLNKGTLYKSTNLTDWVDTKIRPIDEKTIDQILSLLKKQNLPERYYIWAPHVVKIGSKWNMYLSLENKGGIIVLQSDSPTGPFKFPGAPFILISNEMMNWDYDAIDPFVIKRRSKLWLFFGSSFGVYRSRLNSDGLSLHKKNKFVHVAGPHNPKQLVDGKVHGGYEGVYLFKKGRYWYCIVSKRMDYSLYVGRSRSLTGDFEDIDGRLLRDGYGTRMNYPSSEFKSPGHNGEIFIDKNNRYYIFYHSRTKDLPGSKYGLRQVVLSEIIWKADFPYIKGDTVTKEGNVAPNL